VLNLQLVAVLDVELHEAVHCVVCARLLLVEPRQIFLGQGDVASGANLACARIHDFLNGQFIKEQALRGDSSFQIRYVVNRSDMVALSLSVKRGGQIVYHFAPLVHIEGRRDHRLLGKLSERVARFQVFKVDHTAGKSATIEVLRARLTGREALLIELVVLVDLFFAEKEVPIVNLLQV